MNSPHPNIRIEKVKRIVKFSEPKREEWLMMTVGYRYYVNGKGPMDILGRPFKEPEKNTMTEYFLWAFHGCRHIGE